MNVRNDDEHVYECEKACFSPLVFVATGGGMGPSTTTQRRVEAPNVLLENITLIA